MLSEATADALGRVVAVINGKGGVGKTSIAANLSGQLARADYRILAVDLDLSGNLKLDLGYVGHPLDDDGKGLVDAIWSGNTLPVIESVRDGLDVVPGGKNLEVLAALSLSPLAADLPGGGVAPAFAERLAALADGYDLVVLDGAPGNPILQDMALVAARYVLIPTKTDAAGWGGLRMVGPRVKKAREVNPALTYLGVVLFAHQSNASRVLANTRARLEEVADVVPLFDSFVRHSETAAHDCRSRGQLAHELARDAADNQREILETLRARRSDNVIALPGRLSGTAGSLAGDYAQLAREVLVRISEIEQGSVRERAGE